MVPRRGRRSCHWASDNCGSWSALNGGLGERTGGHLTRGHPLTLALPSLVQPLCHLWEEPDSHLLSAFPPI